jgi:hypothetical protein
LDPSRYDSHEVATDDAALASAAAGGAALAPAAAEAAALLPPALRAVPPVARALDGWGGLAMTHAELACHLATLASELTATVAHLCGGALAFPSGHSSRRLRRSAIPAAMSSDQPASWL